MILGARRARPRIITESPIRNARSLMHSGQTAAEVLRSLGRFRATFYRPAPWLGLLPGSVAVDDSLVADDAK